MRTDSSRPGGAMLGGWFPGFVLGVSIGFLLLELPTIGVALVALSLLLIAWKGPRLAASGGLFTGAGLTWTVLFARVTLSCAVGAQLPGEDCGAPLIAPWMTVALVTITLGIITSATAFRRSRRQD